ncbi:MAG TPA: hypothetical protein VM933_02705 [Acidimicrobiales bacterium]|nr:hypothetical protein [Acidimicrobiales bacterium]
MAAPGQFDAAVVVVDAGDAAEVARRIAVGEVSPLEAVGLQVVTGFATEDLTLQLARQLTGAEPSFTEVRTPRSSPAGAPPAAPPTPRR